MIKEELGINEWLELIKEDKNLSGAYISVSQYLYLVEKENKKLKEQVDYLRSNEYLNQLRFERDVLQDIVDKGEVSKEDRNFIDCTHRNTELLEENQELKKQLKPDYYVKGLEGTLKEYQQEMNKIVTQQKEFIKWLEDGIQKVTHTEFFDKRIQRAGLIAYNRCLQKCRSIIGDDK